MININGLEQSEGKYYYQDKLFSGVGFKTCGEKVEALHEFKDGLIIADYKCKYFPDEENISKIDIDSIEFTGEFLNPYAFYENRKFSGIAYEFEGEQEICLGQHFIEEGVPLISLTWHLSGKDKSLSIDRNEFVQIYEWFNDGSLKYFEIYSKEFSKRLIAITLSGQNRLEAVWIEKDYFNWIGNHGAKLEFDYFNSKNSFSNLAVDQIFSLTHSGVDDELFACISSNEGFRGLLELSISRTSLSAKSLLDLVNVETLKKVSIHDERSNLLSAVEQLKRERQDVLIILNGQDLTI